MNDHLHGSATQPSRRSVLIAGAWATPAILTAVGVPLAAASAAPEIEAVSGDVSGRHMTFTDVAVGDPIPLIFQVTQNGSGFSGDATATLVSAAGVAEWDESVLLSGDIAAASVEDGMLFLPLSVIGAGDLTVVLSIGGGSWTFSVSLRD